MDPPPDNFASLTFVRYVLISVGAGSKPHTPIGFNWRKTSFLDRREVGREVALSHQPDVWAHDAVLGLGPLAQSPSFTWWEQKQGDDICIALSLSPRYLLYCLILLILSVWPPTCSLNLYLLFWGSSLCLSSYPDVSLLLNARYFGSLPSIFHFRAWQLLQALTAGVRQVISGLPLSI